MGQVNYAGSKLTLLMAEIQCGLDGAGSGSNIPKIRLKVRHEKASPFERINTQDLVARVKCRMAMYRKLSNILWIFANLMRKLLLNPVLWETSSLEGDNVLSVTAVI